MALILTKLFNKILNNGKFPKIWNLSLLTSIYKSGDPIDCGNYRGICISSCLGKLFTSILQKRLSMYLEKIIYSVKIKVVSEKTIEQLIIYSS